MPIIRLIVAVGVDISTLAADIHAIKGVGIKDIGLSREGSIDTGSGSGGRGKTTFFYSGFWGGDASLTHVFAAALLISGLALFIGLVKQHLGDTLIGIDFRR